MPLLLGITRAGADIGLCIIAVMFLSHCALRHDWQWLRQPETKALAALWAFMLATSMASPVHPMEALKAAAIWGRFLLFFAAARFWLLTPSPALQKLGAIALCILFLAAIDTFWQYKTGLSLTGHAMIGEDRLTGPLTKANIGNFFLKIAVPMAGVISYRMIAAGQFKRLWIPALALLTTIAIVMISGERSTALLMLLSFGVIGASLAMFRPQARKWVAAGAAAVAAFVALVAATQPIFMGKVHFFIEQVSDFGNTPYGQLYLAAWRLWRQHPLTGIGAQQFLEACQPAILQVTYCDVHPHNMYFEWLVATGLPGLLLFILAMALILRRLLREASFTGTASILTAFALSEFAVLLFPFVVTQSVFSNWSAALFWYGLSLGVSLPNFAAGRRDA